MWWRGMTKTRRSTTALLALILQLFVLIAVPAAEARMEAGASASVVHIEAESSTTCLPSHDASHCVLCQTLAGGPLPSIRVAAAEAPSIAIRSASHVAHFAAPDSSHCAASPRAPPLA